VYFGTRSRGDADDASPVLTGFAWAAAAAQGELRHSCQHAHKLQSWGWVAHDGRRYGLERVGDAKAGVNLSIEFVQPDRRGAAAAGGRCLPWTAVIRGVPAAKRKRASGGGKLAPTPRAVVSLFSYVAVAEGAGSLTAARAPPGGGVAGGHGVTAIMGRRGGGGGGGGAASTPPSSSSSSSSSFALLVWSHANNTAAAGGRSGTFYRTHATRVSRLGKTSGARQASPLSPGALAEAVTGALAAPELDCDDGGARVLRAALPAGDEWRV
jgi:hypothetical protein